ncbi:hypothetical protein MCAP1_003107 [Malassezia caprae]|uniref:Major facilitator superfamily (MFS) profile domain-containing protein n=1 Tax=Malassezia caprae TaxID=1381934 RepID=A0AAF0EAR0_9BASI|nr:hypothetical protein MCAP1_003107 [Malassezia caprae]
MERTESLSSSVDKEGWLEKQEPLPEETPDGGLRGWLQVLGAHLLVLNGWGYMTSFGIFEPYYVQTLNHSPSDIAWIGSIEIFFLFAMSIFAGRASDAGYTRPLIALGVCLQMVGVFTTSVCKEFWQVLLAQGICQGIGNGLAFTPAYSVVSSYFKTNRVMAMCLTSCGTSTGGLIFPAIAETLLPSIGFGWTVRVMGFVMLFNGVVAVLLIRPHVPPRRDGPLLELSIIKEPTFALYTLGSFFAFWGNFVAYFFVRTFAQQKFQTDESTTFNLLLVMNGIGFPGRIIPAIVADRIGPINSVIPSMVVLGILTGSWMAVKNMSGMWAFVVFYGFFAAAMMGLVPASVPSLSPHVSKNGMHIGLFFSVVSLAGLSGTPIAGRIITIQDGKFTGAQAFGCVSFLVGAVLTLAARYMKAKLEWKRM